MIRLIDERIMEKLRDKPEKVDFQEFVLLVGEWREEKATMSKCPYCINPIEKQATKCVKCLSELEWFEFDGLYGPCKAGASEEMEGALATAKATHQAMLDAAKKKNEDELAELLPELAEKKCVKCSGPVFSDDKLNSISLIDAKMLAREISSFGSYKKCTPCKEKATDKALVLFAIFISSVVLALAFFASES